MSIEFPYQKSKADQAVLWLLNRHGGRINVLKLVKLIFLADREHLFRYGRPIVGGPYCAMPKGPVASSLYDDLNNSSTNPQSLFVRDSNDICSRSVVNEDLLSESDKEILCQINHDFGHWDQFKLNNYTHDLQAYRRNFQDNAVTKSFPLPYDDFFLDGGDPDMLEIIREDQEILRSLE